MSVTSARAFLTVCGVVFIGCVVWFLLGLRKVDFDYRQLSGDLVAPMAIGLISGVFLLVALFLFSRFTEATIERRGGSQVGAGPDAVLVVRWVLRPPRSVDLSDVRQIVLIPNLVLPSRTGPSSVLRVVVRMHNGSVCAFTPRNADFQDRLAATGFEADVDDDVLTATSAARRYPGSTGFGERSATFMGPVAIVVGGIVLMWVIWEAIHL